MRRNTCFHILRWNTILHMFSHVCSHIAAEHICHMFVHILRRNTCVFLIFHICCTYCGETHFSHVFNFIILLFTHVFTYCGGTHVFHIFPNLLHFNYVSRFPALHRFEHCNTSLNTINNEQMSKVSVLSVSSESVPSESESESRASESRASESEPDSENLMLYKYTTFLGLPRECHIQNLHEQLAICQNPVVMEFWSSRQIVQKRSGMRFINIYTTTITKSQDY
jgi:hypothetical protein